MGTACYVYLAYAIIIVSSLMVYDLDLVIRRIRAAPPPEMCGAAASRICDGAPAHQP